MYRVAPGCEVDEILEGKHVAIPSERVNLSEVKILTVDNMNGTITISSNSHTYFMPRYCLILDDSNGSLHHLSYLFSEDSESSLEDFNDPLGLLKDEESSKDRFLKIDFAFHRLNGNGPYLDYEINDPNLGKLSLINQDNGKYSVKGSFSITYMARRTEGFFYFGGRLRHLIGNKVDSVVHRIDKASSVLIYSDYEYKESTTTFMLGSRAILSEIQSFQLYSEGYIGISTTSTELLLNTRTGSEEAQSKIKLEGFAGPTLLLEVGGEVNFNDSLMFNFFTGYEYVKVRRVDYEEDGIQSSENSRFDFSNASLGIGLTVYF